MQLPNSRRPLPVRLRLVRFLFQPGMVAALASFFLGLMWLLAVKPLNAPDEPAHLQAVMQVRKQGILPEVHFDARNPAGDVIGRPGDEATREYTVAQGMAWIPYMLIPYESSQPPLHYVAAAALSLPFPPRPQIVLLIARLTATLFGAAAVYFLWAAARQFAPGAPMWAVAVAGVVALLPQFCFNNATAGNDGAANLAGAAAFYVWFRGLREPRYDRWLLKAGAIVGLGILAKLTAVALLPGLALVWVFRAINYAGGLSKWQAGLRKLMPLGAGAAAGVLLVCGWWLVRNIVVYGDYTGVSNALEFYRGKFSVVDYSDPARRADSLRILWQSTWGSFGWMQFGLPDYLYNQAGVVCIVVLVLSAVALLIAVVRRRIPTHTWQAAIIMVAVSTTLIAGFVQFNATVAMEPQGRYLFLMLLPAGLAFTGGLHALARWRFLRVFALSLPIVWLAYVNWIGLRIVSTH